MSGEGGEAPAVDPALDRHLSELVELLRIPSISPLPGWEAALAEAAEWLAAAVRGSGGDAKVLATARNPLVLGSFGCGLPDAPRVLLYGHYDVQPPGEETAWTSPPFDPEVRDGCLYARGAADDKGGLHALLAAAGDLFAEGLLRCDVLLLADGEEEIGGASAVEWVATSAARLDAAIVFDVGMSGPCQPQLTTALRGLATGRIELITADGDLHSGAFGGAVLNAANALAAAVAALGPRDGALPDQLRGGVAAVGDEPEAWASLRSGAEMIAAAGANASDTAAASEFYPRTLTRPALDVLGLRAGDVRTAAMAIPARAEAVLSLRLVPDQVPEQAWAAVASLVREHLPDTVTVSDELLVRSPPWRMTSQGAVRQIAAGAIEKASGNACPAVPNGGSIPVVASLGQAGVPVVLSGVTLPDDNIHAADERIPLESYSLAYRMGRQLLGDLGAGLAPGDPDPALRRT